jgi:hypothetical protein
MDLYYTPIFVCTDGDRDGAVGIGTRYWLDGPRSKPSEGEYFRSRPDQPWAHPASYTSTGSFPGNMRPWRSVNHPPHLTPKLKKEYSYTSPPHLCLRGLLLGDLNLYPCPDVSMRMAIYAETCRRAYVYV